MPIETRQELPVVFRHQDRVDHEVADVEHEPRQKPAGHDLCPVDGHVMLLLLE
jgi:hypothetical protein